MIDGPPVTLIHGYPTSSHDWEPIADRLAEAGFRVTMLDLLGFGASDKPADHKYQLTEQASIVEALWHHLDIGDTALVAHDYGVSVAQELLARDPRRVTKMAFLNGGLWPDLYRPLPIQRLLKGPLGGIAARLSSEVTFRMTMRKISGRPVSDDVLHEMWLAASANGGKVILRRLMDYLDERVANQGRWRASLESYSGPTQFIWGPADPISGGHLLPRIRERFPNAEIVALETPTPVGHYPQVEDPDAVGEALVSFLQR